LNDPIRTDSGDGWTLTMTDEHVAIAFHSGAPDGKTLTQLRAFMRWVPRRHWECAPDHALYDRALKVAKTATTWESVGETRPSAWDGWGHDGTGKP
jgi:hypothetical protein